MPEEKTPDNNQESNAGSAGNTWETVLAGLDDNAKGAFETHVSGLKSALDKERESAKTKEGEIKSLAIQIKELQAVAGDSEKLKAKISEMDAAIGDRDSKLMNAEKTFEVKLAALKAGAFDTEDILKHIKLEDIAYANGSIAGLNEQIEKIKTAKPYLFGETKKVNANDIDASKGGGTAEPDYAAMEKMSMSEYAEYRAKQKK